MLARLQQVIILLLTTSALAWSGTWWQKNPALAIAGSIAIISAHSFLLAIEFVVAGLVNRSGSPHTPPWWDLFKAWQGEVLITPLVFYWWQPFRSNTLPDQLHPDRARDGRRGVVLIHGFFCNRGFWTPWLRLLHARGRQFVAVNLEPVFGSIDDYVNTIEDAIVKVTAATGMAPVIVCHSMGGLVARAWMRAHAGYERVHHVITIGTPHQGTWLGRFGYSINANQMRMGSAWIEAIARHERTKVSPAVTCWYSNCDNIVFPAATATLNGADNRFVPATAHVQMAFHKPVMDGAMAIIDAM